MEETAIEGMMQMSKSSVPESREQFRTRLTDAMRRSQPYSDWECVWDTTLGEMGEAVYAQALRDIFDGSNYLHLDMDTVTVQEYIEQFAAERGIDLEKQS